MTLPNRNLINPAFLTKNLLGRYPIFPLNTSSWEICKLLCFKQYQSFYHKFCYRNRIKLKV